MSDKTRDIAEEIRTGQAILEALKSEQGSQNGNGHDESYLLFQSYDDEGNAQAVNKRHSGQFLHCLSLGWLHYTGTHWTTKLAESKLERAIVDTLKARGIAASMAEDENTDLSKLKTAARPKTANIKNAKFNLSSIVATHIDEFDNSPDLLNVKNGVLNLKTGELSPHTPEEMFTYCLNTEYKPEADTMEWIEFLWDSLTPEGKDFSIKENEEYNELLDFIKCAVGYTLTGQTIEQCMFYVQGPTRAGKGLFLQTLLKVMGKPLSISIPFDTFTKKRDGDGQNFDLAGLRNSRFAAASESNKTRMINAETVKNVTGGDETRCAHKNKPYFEYLPKYKIWLATNNNVVADASDDAFWNRLRVINFPNSHAGKEDFGFGNRLQTKEGLEAVLAWAVEGSMKWYKDLADGPGLGRPDLIRRLTKVHREENDLVKQFIAECCIVGENKIATIANMTAAFKEWCQDRNVDPYRGFRFKESMNNKGFYSKLQSVGGTTKRRWQGIGLLAEQ